MIASRFPNDPSVIAAWPFTQTVAAHDLLDALEQAEDEAARRAREHDGA